MLGVEVVDQRPSESALRQLQCPMVSQCRPSQVELSRRVGGLQVGEDLHGRGVALVPSRESKYVGIEERHDVAASRRDVDHEEKVERCGRPGVASKSPKP